MRKNYIYVIALLLLPNYLFSQSNSIWKHVSTTEILSQRLPDVQVEKYQTFEADMKLLLLTLEQSPLERASIVNLKNSSHNIELPMPNGNLELFQIIESPVMSPGLQARYPQIKTYLVQGITDATMNGRVSFTQKGFKAMLHGVDGTVLIEPYSSFNENLYISYWSKDYTLTNPDFEFSCSVSGQDISLHSLSDVREVAAVPHGTELRTYELAMAVDSSFFNLAGGTNALALAEVATIVNQVNTLYERDVAIRMILIDNTDDLFFTNSTSPYPYTSTNACALRAENQTIIDNIIGSDNYDIGHVLFVNFNSGCASFNAVCDNSSKASGVTGWSSPFTNPFFTGVVSHEMGHQFNATHTWNGPGCTNDQWSETTAYEPGSGSTIMAYPSVCGAADNIQNSFDFNFHLNSINRISDYSTISDGNNCAAISATGNTIPSVNAGADFTIPVNTPFILTGSGSDADGDAVTYSWEQFDLGPRVTPNDPTTPGPLFRSFPPVPIPSRTFPQLTDILSNTSTKGEVLPTIGRELNFSITVRDNRAGGGGVNSDAMVVTVDGAIGPFRVTSPNNSDPICPGTYTVTWDVAGSDALAANVNILLSYDGGFTFPETLASNTPNDGSQNVSISCTHSSQARIKVESVGNIFFDISNANFSIGDNNPPTFTVPADVTVYVDDNCVADTDPSITGEPTNVNDNCDTDPTIDYVDVIIPGTCVGEYTISRTWIVTDNCALASEQIQEIFVEDNIAPTFTVPENTTIYKDENCEHDADPAITGEPTNIDDNCDPNPTVSYFDVTVPGSCIGEEIITRTWIVEDDCGNPTEQDQIILVKDEMPPVISDVSVTPDILWPPNHKMVDVMVNYQAVDNCSMVTNSLTVVSNEPDNGTGDGNTTGDIEVIDENHVRLRSERSGSGTGRIYTITIHSEDDCGNISTEDVEVYVPQNMNNNSMMMALVYPNPSSDNFILDLSRVDGLEDFTQLQMVVLDINGRVIELLNVEPQSLIRFGNRYNRGTYYLQIKNENEVLGSIQILKQ